VATLLDAELDPDRHGLGGQDHVHGPFHVGHLHAGVRDPVGDGDGGQGGGHLVEAVGVLGQPGDVVGVALDDHGQHGRQQEGVGARPQGEVEVGHVGRLRAAGVDDQHPAAGLDLDLVDHLAGVAEAVGQPGVAADHHQQVAVVDALGGVGRLGPEHLPVDPEVARLLLGQGAEVARRAHPFHEAEPVGAPGVVPLAPAAVIGERSRTARGRIRVPDGTEAGGDLGQGGVPVDGLVRPVGPAP
jgi:hypothetical protein